MERITQKDLEYLVKRINEVTGSPIAQYTKKEKATSTDPGYRGNIGNYHLSYAYGGVKLERMCNEGGGVNTVSTGGFGTKRELYDWMRAYLDGMSERTAKEGLIDACKAIAALADGQGRKNMVMVAGQAKQALAAIGIE